MRQTKSLVSLPARTKPMSNIQIIETLCALVDEQNRIIRAQSIRLGELGAVFMTDEIAAADELYRKILGNGENE